MSETQKENHRIEKERNLIGRKVIRKKGDFAEIDKKEGVI